MKPGVFTQLHTHLVFAVKHRECLLVKDIRAEVFNYIGGIIANRKHRPIIINGVSDHIHILIGLSPNDKISDLVGNIKKDSSGFINEKNWMQGKFHWQDGYGAFSYSKSQLDDIYNYIANQEKHHSKKTFKDEYINILKKFGVEYNEKYLFDFFN
jgi:REP element-mobilizing transposase RayT